MPDQFCDRDTGSTALAPEDLDRIMTAAFVRVPAPQDTDSDRPIIDDARIEVFELLGHGGLGAVYRCHDRRMKRDVALKVLRARHTGNLAARDGLLWESRLGARLDHPGIVPVHEIGVDATGRPYFTMRIVRGETLRAVLLTERTGEAGRARLLRVLLQVAEAVAHAHRAGIVHSDLKPENVMVGPNGEVLVLDWGLAQGLDVQDDNRPSASSSKAGTPAYMAPERGVSPPPPIGPTIDVFGLGVILLEVLTGPEAAATTASTSVAPGSGAALARQLAGSHPADLAALATDSVATQPAARPADAGEFGRRLSAVLGRLDEDARQARLDAAAADAQAAAERRARRTVQQLSLALLIAGLVASVLWVRAKRVHEERRDGQARLVQDALDGSRARTAGLQLGLSFEALRDANELLERAARGLDADLVPPEWAGRLETERVALAQKLAAAAVDASERRWRDDLIASLSACRLRGLSGMHSPGLGQAIVAALEAANMNPRANTAAELGAPYPLGAERAALVDALDTWAMFGLSASAKSADADEVCRIRTVAQELDSDPDRKAVRAAIMAGDRGAIERLMPTKTSPPYRSATIYVMLGASLHDEPARANAVWREGCFAFPDDPWCHALLGYNAPDLEFERAREHLWAAIALEPRNPSAWTNLAITYHKSGRADEVLRTFRYVAEVLRPESDIELGNYWAAQFDAGLTNEALVTAQRWNELHPADLRSCATIIQTLKALGRDDDVMSEERRFAQQWRDDGSCAGVPIIIGEALWHTGAMVEARRAFEPRNEHSADERAHRRFLIGSVAMADGEFEEAMGHFEEISSDWKWGARAQGMQGLAFIRLDRLVEARDVLTRVLPLGAQDPTWDQPTHQWLEVVEEGLRLDTVIAGNVKGRDAVEYAAAARRAASKGNAARAFELYDRAFTPDIEAANILPSEGAEAALRALAQLDYPLDKRAASYRVSAWQWLRYHFDVLKLNYDASSSHPKWIEQLRTWETNPAFAPVRSAEELAKLPEDAREAWSTLWRDVEAFLQSLDD